MSRACSLEAMGACGVTIVLSQRRADSEQPIGRRREWPDLLGEVTRGELRTL
jgi:hypothetical protein